jgi:FkbM family methyltransferase
MKRDPFADMQTKVKKSNPVIFDVGANVGHTIYALNQKFPGSTIHAFEPSPNTYQSLLHNTARYDNVKVWQNGVGSGRAVLPFKENTHSDMSSFLDPGEKCWGSVEKVTNVEIITLDSFAKEHNIEFIDILKCDTQGYEYEVFKGAEGLINEGKIGVIYFEIIFSDMYNNLTPFYETLRYLTERGFIIASFYDQHYRNNVLSWADVMFVKKSEG